ncbi:hypothetical protein CHLRE_17g741272v5 [Chlamydomonas reinhardtii]|uniref:Uncharacterized protein n=1 Tax=Chlamydomonas reinhardtii TaxID=3055 RepID=A0A2K3CRS1_CHLRE|nr:uncharacterized protein CHLRE_17g741272v5 [Chlamydomonas reinhardtii]PNW70978.1 hypothetical protein CHLRE_17g741272v5 [Chlamydomonas reinhardtii]
MFLAWAVQRYAVSTTDGTLSALSDWQRARGVPAAAAIRRDPMVRRLGVQIQLEAAGSVAAQPQMKAPVPDRAAGMARGLAGHHQRLLL